MLTAPRRMNASASVSITPAKCGWPTMMRSTRASSRYANAAASPMVTGTAAQNGTPATEISPHPVKADAISMSPCAKLRTSVAL
jgi:hypothetical protein